MNEEKQNVIRDEEHANNYTRRYYIVPDGTVSIGRESFRNNTNLEKIYIPKSVKYIKDGAFSGCGKVEIYCEDEPQPDWDYGMMKVIQSYDIVTPEDDAFNFHRSGGGFTSTRIEREVEKFCNWNPENRPVHTHVSKDVTADWGD